MSFITKGRAGRQFGDSIFVINAVEWLAMIPKRDWSKKR